MEDNNQPQPRNTNPEPTPTPQPHQPQYPAPQQPQATPQPQPPAMQQPTGSPQVQPQENATNQPTEKEGIGEKINNYAEELDKKMSGIPMSLYGIIGSACGILALLFAVSGWFWPTLPFGIAAVSLGIAAKFQKNDNTGFYIALTFGIMSLIFFIFIWMFYYHGPGRMAP